MFCEVGIILSRYRCKDLAPFSMTKAILSMRSRASVVGIDFDNTIACYDVLLHRLAQEKRLIPPGFQPGKKAIRDYIRRLPEGEMHWQRLQAILYGPAIDGAQLFDGVMRFLCRCKESGIHVFIVSHKTTFSNLLMSGVNFRQAATCWMRQHGLFEHGTTGLTTEQVFYEATRSEKVGRIRSLGCTDFIDDLEETFLEESFPRDVNKLLFNPHAEPVRTSEVCNCSHWSQIEEFIFS